MMKGADLIEMDIRFEQQSTTRHLPLLAVVSKKLAEMPRLVRQLRPGVEQEPVRLLQSPSVRLLQRSPERVLQSPPVMLLAEQPRGTSPGRSPIPGGAAAETRGVSISAEGWRSWIPDCHRRHEGLGCREDGRVGPVPYVTDRNRHSQAFSRLGKPTICPRDERSRWRHGRGRGAKASTLWLSSNHAGASVILQGRVGITRNSAVSLLHYDLDAAAALRPRSPRCDDHSSGIGWCRQTYHKKATMNPKGLGST